MKEKIWITTEQMLKTLKNDPNNEHEYRHWLGRIVFSTYWLQFNSEKNQFGISIDGFHYDWYSEAEFLSFYASHWWIKEDEFY